MFIQRKSVPITLSYYWKPISCLRIYTKRFESKRIIDQIVSCWMSILARGVVRLNLRYAVWYILTFMFVYIYTADEGYAGTNETLWIGGSDRVSEGTFVWGDTGNIIQHQTWKPSWCILTLFLASYWPIHFSSEVWFKHILLTPKQVKNLYKWISIRWWQNEKFTMNDEHTQS